MKKFSQYIFGGIVVMLAVMLVLDFVYTKVYETSNPRTKFQYLRSLKNTKIDYVFIGSSRVENGIVPSIIKNKTGKSAVNFGFQAAKLGDIYTLLQLIKAYNIQYEKIFIQVDYIYNIDGHSNIFQFEMTPFVRENEVTKSYSDTYAANPIANYYVPFYRFCNNDIKIGLREVFTNLVNKKTNVIAQNGYGARFGNAKELKGSLPETIKDKNVILDNIQAFIKKNNMTVVFYCAPFCKNNQNKDFTTKLSAKIPEFQDFSKILVDDSLFLDCNHLNDSGAKRFTEIFTEKLLMK